MDLVSPALLWFIIGLFFLVLEFIIPGVVIVFFGLGAWFVSLLCLLVGIPLDLQLILFISSSVFFLLALRRYLKNKLFKDQEPIVAELEDEFVGHRAIVTRPISPKLNGQVEFHGSQWDAQSDKEIKAGTPVRIIKKKNITLIVDPL